VPREDEFAAGPYDLSSPPEWHSFPGLYPPLYTQTPDVFFDWVAPFLPEIELRVLLYLIRRTLGFKKQGDQITIEQIAGGIITRDGTRLDWGAQLGERSVQRALAGLEAKGLIERHRQLDPERGWRPSYIRLRLCDQSGQAWQSRARQGHPPGVQPDGRGVSGESPAWRTARHLPGVPEIASPSQAPAVQRDTYKKQRSISTDLQETASPPTPQETADAMSPGEPRAVPDRPDSGHACSTHDIGAEIAASVSASGAALWAQIKEELAAVLAPAVYQTRVAATRQIDLGDGALTVLCPDVASCRWLEHRLGRMIAEIAASLVDAAPPLRFTTPD
jgi:hypothetical protein